MAGLDDLYAESCPKCWRESVALYARERTASEYLDTRSAFTNFKKGKVDEARNKLFELYSGNLRKGVGQVYRHTTTNRAHQERLVLFEKNASRFAAHKADYAIRALERAKAHKPEEFDKNGRAILGAFNRFQVAEYNTAVARCRTARQFDGFAERAEILPNIKWLRTRSATPRKEHLAYAGLVLPKNHPFWNSNQPGNLWNCKCDWIETTGAARPAPPEATWVKPAVGLEGNPALTGQIITDRATYIAKTRLTAEQVGAFAYPDAMSPLRISVLANSRELLDNVLTGRILAGNPAVKQIAIAPHIVRHRVKNPEYLINGAIADAKRIQGENGITAAFVSALEQGSRVVIIDLTKHMDDMFLKINLLASKLYGRRVDFESGRITGSYFVYRGRSVAIPAEVFVGTHDEVMGRIKALLERLEG